MKPKVTIITPVYNCAKYIGETISSVLRQNYPNMQYVVIDDGSTDKPVYPPNSYNFRVIRHIHNKGEQVRVNEGLTHTEGEYFMIVNADDPLLLGAVNELVKFMEANPSALCGYPNYKVINDDGSFHHYVKTRDYDFEWMVRNHTWIPSAGAIFRSNVIKLIGYRDEHFTWMGDADYWLRIGLAGPMAHVDYNLACWRKRSNQASNVKSNLRAREHIDVMRKFYATLDLPQELVEVKGEAMCWAYLVAAVVTDSLLNRFKYAFKAIIAYPNLFITIRFWGLFFKRFLDLIRR